MAGRRAARERAVPHSPADSAAPLPQQPAPAGGRESVTRSLEGAIRGLSRPDTAPRDALVLSLVAGRERVGIARYGQTLRTFTGRDPYVDELEEMLDAIQYRHQAWMQHQEEQRRLRLYEGILRRLAASRCGGDGMAGQPCRCGTELCPPRLAELALGIGGDAAAGPPLFSAEEAEIAVRGLGAAGGGGQ